MATRARQLAGFASRTRALLLLTLRRGAYRRALRKFPAIEGPALIVGSAPEPARPAGLDDSWFVISVNASQLVSDDFGLSDPDMTIFRDGIMLPGKHQDRVWQALKGKRTGNAVATIGSSDDRGLADFIRKRDYQADRVTDLSRHVRGALIKEMTGLLYVTLAGSKGISNGMLSALLAARLGANPVVMSGFSFQGGWYFAPGVTTRRGHIGADADVCRAVVKRGLPIFAADPEFAEKSGLPLWTDKPHKPN